MDVIILDAGEGKRLRPLTFKKQKCLIDINNFTILDYQLGLLSKKNLNITIVTGYLSEQIEERAKNYKNVQIIENKDYNSTDNAYSLLLGFSKIKSRKVIILDGDVLFDEALLDKIINSSFENIFLVDFSQKITPEDAQIKIEDGFVVEFGKQVNGQGIYISMCLLGGELLNKFINKLKENKYPKTWYSKPLSDLLKDHPKSIHVIDSENLKWIEIDNFKDLKRAKELFKDEKI